MVVTTTWHLIALPQRIHKERFFLASPRCQVSWSPWVRYLWLCPIICVLVLQLIIIVPGPLATVIVAPISPWPINKTNKGGERNWVLIANSMSAAGHFTRLKVTRDGGCLLFKKKFCAYKTT